MEVQMTLACGLQACIGSLWKDESCDFKIVIEDTSYPCHSFILSTCSIFFKRLFRSQLKECLKGCVKLNRMTKETFDVIINSIYRGTDGLTEDNVFDVWAAAELLQIEYLSHECSRFIFRNLSADNCFKYLNRSTRFWPHVTCFACLNVIAKNFEKFKNTDSFLRLPVHYLYQIIASDNLAANSEDSVVESLFKWVEYVPGTLDSQTPNEMLPLTGISTHRGDQEDDIFSRLYYAEFQSSAVVTPYILSSGVFAKLNRSSEMYSNPRNDEVPCHPDDVQSSEQPASTTNHVSRTCQTDSVEDRKEKFSKILSVCRLFLASPVYLENILENHRDMLIVTGAYNMVFKALMYTLSVGRRHDSWPQGAVYRDSSSKKHVMVFFSENKFKAFKLRTGTVHEFANAPEDIHKKHNNGRVAVFGNVLYFMYEDIDRFINFNVLTKQKRWALVNDCELDACSGKMLLAHGSYIYDFKVENNNFMLGRYSFIHGDFREWMMGVCAQNIIANCLIRFQQYIVVFGTENNVVTAYYFNTEIEKTHKCNISMDGTSQDMMSFCVSEDVYILQRNGSLWKIFSTETTPVNFELISKLWDFDCSLRGCVLFRKKLFIFCDEEEQMKSGTLRTSFPGVYEDIDMIQINSRTQCVPMVLPQCWLD